ncbi:hypothetical protein G6F46_004390 [Rhizopus delemar]|nr:hypothetical protein G6F54_008208 [Rhizopus delemar]KAG1507822.1 hypothetical protein G6F53_008657 [Rhizopus delemar]KAG1582667.1 hypothetical protein G6F48_009008 [Rhizopus delemar]KAG1592609.1 hypothetical protein G6F47_009376 [Rhizopus delemar]KAG1617819.1 hypothetical protein G6F46_004390 [Rhizopus delemar]
MNINEHIDSTSLSAWASALLQRIEQLETRLSDSLLLNGDPNVVYRAPGADYTPSDTILAQHPYITEDFFRRPMDESQWRRYIFECPKNVLRDYDPQKLNNVQLSHQAKLVDSQLSHIQYRLSSITRPLDWYTYQLLQNKWDPITLHRQTHGIVTAIHELLSDLASHITTLRSQNVYRGILGRVGVPLESDENLLLDPTVMVEHIKLQRTVQQVTQPTSNKKRNNRPRPKRPASGDALSTSLSSTNGSSSHADNSNVTQTSSKDFQQRYTPKKTN